MKAIKFPRFFLLLAVLSAGILSCRSPVPPASQWGDTVWMESGQWQVGVSASAGRIVHLSEPEGPNFLRLNLETAENTVPPNGRWDWLDYGGDWIWPVAQEDWIRLGTEGLWPPPNAFEYVPWTVTRGEREGPWMLMELQVGDPLHIVVSRRIHLPDAYPVQLRIEQSIERSAHSDIPVCIWQVAQVPADSEVLMERLPDSPQSDGYVNIIGTDISPRALRVHEDHVAFTCGISHAKLGTDGEWIKGGGLRIEVENPVGGLGLPDGGCSVALAHHPDKSYVEIETMSPRWNLKPGERVANRLVYTRVSPPDGPEGSGAFGENLYWPGDFERGFAGGCFSTTVRGVLSHLENRTPGGAGSWELAPGYQHLELLVPAHRKGVVRFRAKSPHPQRVTLKVVAPEDRLEKIAAGEKSRVENLHVEVPASEDWMSFEIPFETGKAYPSPPYTELLITAYNGQQAPAYLDDLEVRMAPGPAVEPGRPLRPGPWPGETVSLRRSPGEDGGVPMAWSSFAAEGLGGSRVRISADVTFLTMEAPYEPWSSVLFTLHEGAGPEGELIAPLGGRPFWCPLGMSAPPGEARRITAEYTLPEKVGTLSLVVQVQEGIGSNAARVGNVRVDLLP